MKNLVYSLKTIMPWYVKIAAKLFLSRLPVPYEFWRHIGLFRHGDTNIPQRALNTVTSIFRAAGYPALDGCTVLELGPGDSLCTALIAHAFGARESFLVDVGNFATHDINVYLKMAELLFERKLSHGDLQPITSMEMLLNEINAHYLTQGLESVKNIRPGSVDFVFSNAVLEHVRAVEFKPTMQAIRKIMTPSGLCYHRVDLKDHLSYALNNLRFSDRVWESDFMAKSGFYTNRIGYKEMLSIFREVGFSVQILDLNRFPHLPTPQAKMAPRFQMRDKEDLLVSGFAVLLRLM
jgi:hypothetical protein